MPERKNWAVVPVLAQTVETVVLVTECEDCIIFDAIHTVTTFTGPSLGAIYDPDDGLPLSYEGERAWGDGRLYS